MKTSRTQKNDMSQFADLLARHAEETIGFNDTTELTQVLEARMTRVGLVGPRTDNGSMKMEDGVAYGYMAQKIAERYEELDRHYNANFESDPLREAIIDVLYELYELYESFTLQDLVTRNWVRGTTLPDDKGVPRELTGLVCGACGQNPLYFDPNDMSRCLDGECSGR